MIGPRRVIWRYDPLILSSRTPLEYHRENFGRIAESLTDATKRVMFSFLDFYGKAKNRLRAIERDHGIVIDNIGGEELREERRKLLKDMHGSAVENGMELYSCAEGEDLDEIGVRHGHCIDAGLVRELFGDKGKYAKDRYQRKECGCVESVDMGVYDSCPFQCAYCYANASPKKIAANQKKHTPKGSALIDDYPLEQPGTKSVEIVKPSQQSLF